MKSWDRTNRWRHRSFLPSKGYRVLCWSSRFRRINIKRCIIYSRPHKHRVRCLRSAKGADKDCERSQWAKKFALSRTISKPFPSRIPKTAAIYAGVIELMPEIIDWTLQEERITIKRRKKDNACRFTKGKIPIIEGERAAVPITHSAKGAAATWKTDANRI